jgi:hypothetical protein
MTDDVLRSAKRAWRKSMDRDDAFAAPHRDRRLLGSRRRSPWARRTVLVSPVVGVALALLAGSAMAAVAGARWLGRAPFGSMFSSTSSEAAPLPPRPRLLQEPTASSTVAMAGASVHADPSQGEPSVPQPAVTSAAHAPTNEDPQRLWRAAEEALARGDRSAAERLLDSLVTMRTPSELHDRASLSLAELVLARGDLVSGRARLASLARSIDPALAAEAVFLEAQAASQEAERVAIYERYLATRPPSPYVEQAMVERARALLRGGDVAGARACSADLHRLPLLPSIVKPSVEDLDRRLAREHATD